MSFKPPAKPQKQVKRYRAGQVPENYKDDLSDSEDSDQEQQQQEETLKRRGELSFAQKEVNTGIEQVTLTDKDVSSDRRLQRLQQAQQSMKQDNDGFRQRRREAASSDEEEQEESDEESKARERMRLKQIALQQQEITQPEEEEEEEEEDSEEEVNLDALRKCDLTAYIVGIE